MSAEHVDGLVACYAFGALDPLDRERLARHTGVCTRCAERAAHALEITARLPYAVTLYAAPPGLKTLLFDQMRDDENMHYEPREAASTEPMQADLPSTIHPASLRKAAPRPLWYRLLAAIIPWTAAVAGWIIVAALVIYNQGLSDRLRTTKSDLQTQISGLNNQLVDARTLQGYLTLQGVEVRTLKNWVSATSRTRVELVMAPGFLHAIVLARDLNPLPSDRVYEIWVEAESGHYLAVGTLATRRPLGEGMSIIAGVQALDRYTLLGISVEPAPGSKQPTAPLLFTTPLATTAPAPNRAAASAKTETPVPPRTIQHMRKSRR